MSSKKFLVESRHQNKKYQNRTLRGLVSQDFVGLALTSSGLKLNATLR